MKRYHKNEEIETVEMADELGMLNIKTGLYYVLDSIGVEIWSMLEQPNDINSIVLALQKEYDVNHLNCKEGVEALIFSMKDKGLILEV